MCLCRLTAKLSASCCVSSLGDRDVVFLQPVGEFAGRCVVAPCDKSRCGSIREQHRDFGAERIEFALAGAFGPPERQAGGFSCAEGFLGAGGDQVAFDLGGHREGHRDDLALDGLIQPPASLDGIDPDAGLRGDGEDFHTFEHGASEPGEFTDDQGITGVQLVYDRGNPALSPGDPSGGRFLDQGDPPEIFPVGQGQDIGPVLVQVLRVSGDPEIANGLGWVGGGHWSEFEEKGVMCDKQPLLIWLIQWVSLYQSPVENDRCHLSQITGDD